MIVILEGPDGSGKTTLARTLAGVFNLKYHHEGPTPEHPSPYVYYGQLLLQWKTQRIVTDRFAQGERIYGPILRGRDRFGHAEWQSFQRLMDFVGAVRILCLPTYEDCRRAWASGRPEMIAEEATFQKTYFAWSRSAHEHDYIYDWTSDDELGLIGQLRKHDSKETS